MFEPKNPKQTLRTRTSEALFKVGQRVESTPGFIKNTRYLPFRGTVVGFCRRKFYVRVVRDNTSDPVVVHPSYLRGL